MSKRHPSYPDVSMGSRAVLIDDHTADRVLTLLNTLIEAAKVTGRFSYDSSIVLSHDSFIKIEADIETLECALAKD